MRKTAGLTQEKLAELSDIDAKNLSKIENGLHLPTYQTLKKLSKILYFNINEIEYKTDDIQFKSQIYYKILKILNAVKSEYDLNIYYDIICSVNKALSKKN